MSRWIDLDAYTIHDHSVTIGESDAIAAEPPGMEYTVEQTVTYWRDVAHVLDPHADTSLFGDDCYYDTILSHLSGNIGTNRDSRRHICNEGDTAVADDLLRTVLRPVVVLDCRDIPRECFITPTDITARLQRLRHDVVPGEVIAIWTTHLYGTRGYWLSHTGVHPEVMYQIVGMGVQEIITSGWGIDMAMDLLYQKLRAGEITRFWPAHYAAGDCDVDITENWAEMGQLTTTGSLVTFAPLPIHQGASAPVRAWSLVPKHPSKRRGRLF